MARYIGPKSRIARKFKEPIFGPDKVLEKKNYPPGQHGLSKKRSKQSEYAVQLQEKQKAKYTYGILERQFAKIYTMAQRAHGVTGEVLLQLIDVHHYELEQFPYDKLHYQYVIQLIAIKPHQLHHVHVVPLYKS